MLILGSENGKNLPLKYNKWEILRKTYHGLQIWQDKK
jgi:hypothetical protein